MLRNSMTIPRDPWFAGITSLLSGLILVIPLMLIIQILTQGVAHLSPEFLLADVADSGREGGIGPILVSTVAILAVCMASALPLGIGCALYLSEQLASNSRSARVLSFSLDVLSGVPSIVFGLFGYRFFAIELGLGFSILSGGLSLACMVLPLIIRGCEQSFRAIPDGYRQAALALALSRSGFISRVLLPTAAPGIAVAVILSVGRALAETAVLLFTAGYVTRLPDSLFDSGRSLSVHIYDLALNVPGGAPNAAATSVVLIGLLISFNVAARRLGRYVQEIRQS